jgi:hypothetical protein
MLKTSIVRGGDHSEVNVGKVGTERILTIQSARSQ